MAINLKESLEKLFYKNFDNSWQIDLIKNWDLIIGKLNTKVKLEKVTDDTLFLGVSDSCWMQELFLLSNLIINKVNSNLDKPRIKNIKLKMSSFNKKNITSKQKFSLDNDYEVELSIIELKALEKIKDPQLSLNLKNFLIKCYQQKKQK